MGKTRYDGWKCKICGAKIHACRDDESVCGWCRLTRPEGARGSSSSRVRFLHPIREATPPDVSRVRVGGGVAKWVYPVFSNGAAYC